MKKLIFLIGILYIIAAVFFIKIFFLDKKSTNIEDSIVIIIPEKKLIKYKNNPKGLFEKTKEYGIGAGFFISDNGNIQTVNHIVENENINYKVIYNNTEYDSEILYRDEEKDLAILKIVSLNEKIFSPIEIENEKKNNGDNIISYGVDIKNLSIISNTGIIINKKSKLGNISNLLEISNPLKPGFSGGPIINSNGKIIGINYAISEGKNYGITQPLEFPQ